MLLFLILGAIGSIALLIEVTKWDTSSDQESWSNYVTRNIKRDRKR